MAETAEKEEVEGVKDAAAGADGEENPSMEEILKSIRGVISGEEGAEGEGGAENAGGEQSGESDDDILELTEMEIAEEETVAEEAVPAEGTDAVAAEVGGDAPTEDAAAEPVAEKVEGAAEDAPAEAGAGDGEEKSVLDDIDSALEDESAEAAAKTEGEEAKPEAAEAEDGGDDDVLEAEGDAKSEEEAATVDEASADSGGEGDDKKTLLNDKTAEESADTLKTLVNNIPKAQVDSPVSRGGTTLEDLVIEAMKPFLAEWLNENLPTIVKQIVTKEIKKLVPQDED